MLNPELTKNNYIILPKFIDERWANTLYKDLLYNGQRDENLNNDSSHDLYVDGNVYNAYKARPGQELLYYMTPIVTKIVNQNLYPTYSWMRLYKNGSRLLQHEDRPACEISLSLHLGSDKPWDFVIECPSGNFHNISLKNPGDAVLYLGCVSKHSRSGAYEGENYGQIFLHYVRSQGPLAYTDSDLNKGDLDYDWRTKLKEDYGQQ